jgi:uncharacterized protein Yka (UPF0111/DUF47 family)
MEKHEKELRKELAKFLRGLADRAESLSLVSNHRMTADGIDLVVVQVEGLREHVERINTMVVDIHKES